MVIKANDCNGCPDCVQCGRNKDYTYTACDVCQRNVEGEKTYEGMCRECAIEYIKENPEEFLEYMED